jgi:hypothetical protein
MLSLKVIKMAAAAEGRHVLEAGAKVPHTGGSRRGPLQQPHDEGGQSRDGATHNKTKGEEGGGTGEGGNGAKAVALSREHTAQVAATTVLRI